MTLIDYTPLPGRHLLLAPLEAGHTPHLIEAALAGQSMFEVMRTVNLHDDQEVRDWVVQSMEQPHSTGDLPYAVIEARTGRAVGCTWYLDVNEHHRRCEIGWSWFATDARGTLVNAESKLLMIEHAIEHSGIQRVEFHADLFDTDYQRSLEKLGATREGVRRSDYLGRDGNRHDTVLYSILPDEWPEIAERLHARIGGPISDDERRQTLSAYEQAMKRSDAPQSIELPLPNK